MPPPNTLMPMDRKDPDTPFHLLFVCTGNTCRSPMAEVVARKAAERRGLTRLEVRSAGVAAFPGMEAAGGAIRASRRRGLDLEGHRSRPLDPELVAWADLILTMSPSHLGGVVAAGGGDHAAVITNVQRVLPGPGEGSGDGPDPTGGVPDPFGGPDELYEVTMEELERLVDGVMDRIEASLQMGGEPGVARTPRQGTEPGEGEAPSRRKGGESGEEGASS